MASLRTNKAGEFILCFRVGGKQYNRALGTDNEREADARLMRAKATLHDLKVGRLALPDDCQDMGTFVLSDGKVTAKPTLPTRTTLDELFKQYRAAMPDGAQAESTRITEDVHFKHLLRLLGKNAPVPSLTTADLQRYVTRRSQENGIRGGKIKRDTIEKELATFRAVWKGFALAHELVKQPFELQFVGKLTLPKTQSKPPFQTLDEIEQQASQPGVTTAQKAALWDSLFLDERQVDELLTIIRDSSTAPPWLYPMATAAAHTGARRSELLRSQCEDVRLSNGSSTIHWREKKRDKSKEFTRRPVRMSTKLTAIMQDWLNTRQPGKSTFGVVSKKQAHDALKNAVAGTKYTNIRGWHLFRHSLASIMAMKGMDSRIIDATLGHTTLEMQERYRHLFPSQQQAAMDSIFG